MRSCTRGMKGLNPVSPRQDAGPISKELSDSPSSALEVRLGPDEPEARCQEANHELFVVTLDAASQSRHGVR